MDIQKTDPEFNEIFRHFTLDEVVNESGFQLEPATRYLAILAALMGCGGTDAYCEILPEAMESGVTPVMAKECVYQAADYLGYGRMLPFLKATNVVFDQMGLQQPLPPQSTTTKDNRLEKGVAAQAAIFGEGMKEAWKAGQMAGCLPPGGVQAAPRLMGA